jgi:chorismate mutase / prephenate dehydratase
VTSLDELRREIDGIDDALLDLLIQRVGIGRRVAAAKGPSSTPSLRPGREAQILRRLAGRARDPLALPTMVQVWREIMSANLAQQAALTVAVPGDGPGNGKDGVETLARVHCGAVARLVKVADPEAALAALAGGAVLLAVLPCPSTAARWRWWLALAQQGESEERPCIVARLPLFQAQPRHPADEAFLLAMAPPDPSGDDLSLFAVSPAAAAPVPAVDTSDDGAWALIEVPGFVDRPQGLAPHAVAHRLGVYARPIAAS